MPTRGDDFDVGVVAVSMVLLYARSGQKQAICDILSKGTLTPTLSLREREKEVGSPAERGVTSCHDIVILGAP